MGEWPSGGEIPGSVDCGPGREPVSFARAPFGADRVRTEEQQRLSVDDGDLWYLQVAEAGRVTQRRPHRPVDEVGRPGVTDDAAAAGGTGVGSGGDEHVPAVAGRVGVDPGVTPSLLVPARQVEDLVPLWIRLEHRPGPPPVPGQKVVGDGETDALHETVFRSADAGVVQIPPVVRPPHDAAGPRGQVIPTRRVPGTRASATSRQDRRSVDTAWPMLAR